MAWLTSTIRLCLFVAVLWTFGAFGQEKWSPKTFLTTFDYDDTLILGIVPVATVEARDLAECSAKCSAYSLCKAIVFSSPAKGGCPTCRLYRDNVCTHGAAFLQNNNGYRIYDVVQCDATTGKCDLTCIQKLNNCLETADLGCPQCGRTDTHGDMCQKPGSGCPKGHMNLRGICYMLSDKVDTQVNLEAQWNSTPFTGLRLAKLRDARVAGFLQSKMPSLDFTFVGLRLDLSGSRWLWPDNSQENSGYVNWKSGEPDFKPENMVEMLPPTYSWNGATANKRGAFICEVSAGGQNSSDCPKGYTLNPVTAKCYRLNNVKRYGRDVKQECNRTGAILAMVKSEDDHIFLTELIGNSSGIDPETPFFIGLEYINNQWTYSDGSLLTTTAFSMWIPTQPDYELERCTAVNNSELYDVHCNAEFMYLVEWIATDCSGWRAQGHDTSGSFKIAVDRTAPEIDMFCDMQEDGGGWTVIEAKILSSRLVNTRVQLPQLNDSFVVDVQTLSIMTMAQVMEVKIGFYRNGSRTTVRIKGFNINVAENHYTCNVQNITDANIVLPDQLSAMLNGSKALPCFGARCFPQRPFGLGPDTADFDWISFKMRPLPVGTS